MKHRYPIGLAETPTGLAYDAKTKRLFIGCRKDPKMVVMDAASGKVIGNSRIGANVDFAACKTVFIDPRGLSGSYFYNTLAALINQCHRGLVVRQ